ncbi:MAG: 4-hydroxythreonine-4-phosphate dehydrogenase PdxA [Proteobacteria bacterium]|nr:4-hydroxythreonine-4-phosphate dehydrogenase PdxA [Pseudomonadota bacterium]
MTVRPRIGVTVGDPAGIGPELVGALLAEGDSGVDLAVYGDVEAVAERVPIPGGIATRAFRSAAVAPGSPDPRAAAGIVESIRCAARDCLQGRLDALVTAPIAKRVLAEGGFAYPGHTELLAETAGSDRAVMLLVGDGLRVGLATVHCALREVPARLAETDLDVVLSVMHDDLERRFAVTRPRIAVCGLNPHAGEGGRFGDEEERLIAPAVERARERGIRASGPFAADSLFFRAASGEFDAVLGMYHDQALGPLKTHAFGKAVNVTLGLPFVRTSVDHGTAFDIAGTGRADAGSMREALRLACELSRNQRDRGDER